jgi:hypothetical protein
MERLLALIGALLCIGGMAIFLYPLAMSAANPTMGPLNMSGIPLALGLFLAGMVLMVLSNFLPPEAPPFPCAVWGSVLSSSSVVESRLTVVVPESKIRAFRCVRVRDMVGL